MDGVGRWQRLARYSRSRGSVFAKSRRRRCRNSVPTAWAASCRITWTNWSNVIYQERNMLDGTHTDSMDVEAFARRNMDSGVHVQPLVGLLKDLRGMHTLLC